LHALIQDACEENWKIGARLPKSPIKQNKKQDVTNRRQIQIEHHYNGVSGTSFYQVYVGPISLKQGQIHQQQQVMNSHLQYQGNSMLSHKPTRVNHAILHI
jgi:hypothetical protein